MPELINVCDIKSLKNGDLPDFTFDNKNILIVKAEDKVYATDRICTHGFAELLTGLMNENEKTVTCPLRISVFKLDNGTPQNLPAEGPLKAYKVHIKDNLVYILME